MVREQTSSENRINMDDLLSAQRLGIVTGGSLTDGLDVRLDAAQSVEDMAVGRYVVILGNKRKFFGMVTDVKLGACNPQLASSPPDVSDPFISEVLTGTSTYGTIHVQPMLTIERGADGDGLTTQLGEPQPVKTVPSHFAPVCDASENDVNSVFGAEDGNHFYLGTPLDMDTRVCINLKRFVERSSGIFGKSGTGKTFLTRLMMIGIAQKTDAVSLIFDMHNEYGWEGTSEGTRKVKGLKQLFQSKVAIFTLDEKSSRDRGSSYDDVVEIGYDQIEVEDIAMLQDALNMTEAQIESMRRIAQTLGETRWLNEYLEMDGQQRDELATRLGLNASTLNVLHRKLDTRLARLPFLKPRASTNSVKRILEMLQKGTHVVLEFGHHSSVDTYILVANILTRRIHEIYVEQMEKAMGNAGARPRPLVIAIEEAHKFLSPQVAHHTIFGTIARELRKYNVTLLVVDQRPSGIADEIMSQIGTRITCLLDDERDINAVLSGVSGSQSLRAVLSKLESKQQALLLGHAVPMPVVVRTRDYGTPDSYAEFQFQEAASINTKLNKATALDDLFN